MRGVAVAAILGSVVSTSAVYAQSDFSGLRIRPGDVVYVTEPSGHEVRGRITGLSPSALTVDGRTFEPAPGLKIERRGDPVWDGALKGFAIGAVVGTVLGSGECSLDWPFWKCVVAVGGWFGAFGTLFDLGHVGRTRVYLGTSGRLPQSMRFAPHPAIVSRSLAVQITF